MKTSSMLEKINNISQFFLSGENMTLNYQEKRICPKCNKKVPLFIKGLKGYCPDCLEELVDFARFDTNYPRDEFLD